MKIVNPKTETLSITYNDIEYTATYYNPAFTIAGVTDESHPNWSASATYALGDYVIVPELKRIYRSGANSNTGVFPPSDDTKWVDYGNINSYSMFATDENIGAVTTFTDCVLEFDFSQSDAIVGVDLDFASAKVYLLDTSNVNYESDYNALKSYSINDAVFYNGKMYVSNENSNTGNTPDVSSKWDERALSFKDEISGRDISCISFAEYFYDTTRSKTRVIITDLEWLASSVLRIEMDGTSKVGTVAYGNIQDLGITLTGLRLRYESTSKFTTNEFTGFRNIIRYGKVRQLDVSVLYDTTDFDIISQTVNEIIDKNVIWIPSENDKFTELITLGYIENFEIPIDEFDKTASQTTIIGVNK